MDINTKLATALYAVLTQKSAINTIMNTPGHALVHAEMIGKSKSEGHIIAALRPSAGGNIQLHYYRFKVAYVCVTFQEPPASWIFQNLKLDGFAKAIDDKKVMYMYNLRTAITSLMSEFGGPVSRAISLEPAHSVVVMMNRDHAKTLTSSSKWVKMIADPAYAKRF